MLKKITIPLFIILIVALTVFLCTKNSEEDLTIVKDTYYTVIQEELPLNSEYHAFNSTVPDKIFVLEDVIWNMHSYEQGDLIKIFVNKNNTVLNIEKITTNDLPKDLLERYNNFFEG